jgi:hypothetical protein
MLTRVPPAVGVLLLAAAACLTTAACGTTTAGSARPAAAPPPATPESLGALMLPADQVGQALGGAEVAVTGEVATPWADRAALTASGPGCAAIAGAASGAAYAGSGWTALRGQVLREPPAAQWAHFAVQSVVLFPRGGAAADFFARSRAEWSGCADRELGYPQAPLPDQAWSVGPVRAEGDMLTVTRVQRSPQQWTCQRALSLRDAVVIDVEACRADGATDAAAVIARAIGERLPAA